MTARKPPIPKLRDRMVREGLRLVFERRTPTKPTEPTSPLQPEATR